MDGTNNNDNNNNDHDTNDVCIPKRYTSFHTIS
jgi:hypothetical protein